MRICSKSEINDICDRISDLILTEVENSIKKKNRKRPNTKRKPYWDIDLSCKWKIMHNAERQYRRVCKDKTCSNYEKTKLKLSFKKSTKGI